MWPDRVSNPGPLTYESGAYRLRYAARLRGNIPIAVDIIIFGIIQGDFLYYIDTGMLRVLMRIAKNIQNTFMLKKTDKNIPIMSPDLAL